MSMSNEGAQDPADAAATPPQEPNPNPDADLVVVEAEEVPAEEADPLFLDAESADVEIVEPSESDTLRAEIDTLRASLEAAQREALDLRNRMLRAAADLDNFRKRTTKEKDDLKKFGAERVVQDFLPIVDNLERALAHASGSDSGSSLVDGVAMVLKQFQSTLERHGVKGFTSRGERFDPERHEAVQQIESEDHPSGTIIEEFQRGYFIHERLLRPAMVVVARNPKDE